MQSAWNTFAGEYDVLLKEPLDVANVGSWLARWSDAEKAVWEARAELKRQRSFDERDAAAQDAYQQFMTDVFPLFRAATQQLIVRLLSLPDFQPDPEQHRFIEHWRSDAALFHPDQLGLQGEIERLIGRYHQLCWSTAGFRDADGEEAWRQQRAQWRLQRAEIDEVMLQIIAFRQQIAQLAGCSDYREYRWRELHRFDFTPDQCLALHDAAIIAITSVSQSIPSSHKLPGTPWENWPVVDNASPIRNFLMMNRCSTPHEQYLLMVRLTWQICLREWKRRVLSILPNDLGKPKEVRNGFFP